MGKILNVLSVFAVISLANAYNPLASSIPEDYGLNILEMLEYYGYPAEAHENIQTPDGYLLTLHRIPHGKNNANQTNKPVVFLQHGLIASATDWINMGPQKGIPYILADLGYDVWMGNARGTTWSRKHITLDPDVDKKAFFDFTWHEIGIYDLPTTIDYVLAWTKQENLYYIGHSQGTTAFWVMASERPEYNAKIRLMSALAPISFMFHLYSRPIRELLERYDELADLVEQYGIYEYLHHTDLMSELLLLLCNDDSPYQTNCVHYLYDSMGANPKQLNLTRLPVIGYTTPAGSSSKQQFHYGQLILSGGFRQFDYNETGNIEKYGQPTPPDYDLTKVTAPVALYYSGADPLSHPYDVQQLASILPNVVRMHLLEDPRWNHIDYIWAIDVVPLLYDKVIELITKY